MQTGGWILTPILLCAGCGIVAEMSCLVSATIDKLTEERKGIIDNYPDYAFAALGPIG